MSTMSTLKMSCLLLLATSALAIANPVAMADSGQSAKISDRSSESQLIQLSIGLEPENRGSFEQTLHEISDPSHQRYGKYLTREEAKLLLQPRPDSADAVKRWLSQAGVPSSDISDQGQFIHARVATHHAEALLGPGINNINRYEGNSLPLEVRSHIATIRSSSSRGMAQGQNRKHYQSRQNGQRRDEETEIDLEKCKVAITPDCLKKLYHMGDQHVEPTGNSLFGIPGFSQQTAQYDELEMFLNAFAPYAAGANFSVELINGGENPQGEYPSGEANLDVQYAVAMAYNLPVRYYAVGGENHDFTPDLDLPDNKKYHIEPFLEFASYLLDLDDDELPRVISISYGTNEQLLPKPYATQVCDMFGQLGARGVSIVVASGDMGPGYSCQSNDGKKKQKFLPVFPASCPYVTTVGATESIGPEVATNFTSGGFSEYFPRPAWQDKVVKKYLGDHGSEWEGFYNPDGRAFPDVATHGFNFQFANHGKVEVFSGTSASAPVFAAMIALLNDHRAKSNKPPMGFLNPWIYGIRSCGFTDITEGKSLGCFGRSVSGLESPVIPGAGWSAVPGWDPVTGLGTPRFDRMKSLSVM